MSADRSTARVEYRASPAENPSRTTGDKADDYLGSYSVVPGRRLSGRYLRLIALDLAPRDWLLLRDLQRVRVLTGLQLERLHFQSIAPASRGRTRRRVLARLTTAGLVTTLDRRIGGVRAGSSGLVYSLTGAGRRLLDQRDGRRLRRRGPHTPGRLFLEHALAITELYVQLSERAADRQGRLTAFSVESDARWPGEPARALLRPDALLVLRREPFEDVVWIELDRGTESRPRVTAKLERYLRFLAFGAPGPLGITPRVLVLVPDERRLRDVIQLVDRLQAPTGFIEVVLEAEAASHLLDALSSGEIEKPP